MATDEWAEAEAVQVVAVVADTHHTKAERTAAEVVADWPQRSLHTVPAAKHTHTHSKTW